MATGSVTTMVFNTKLNFKMIDHSNYHYDEWHTQKKRSSKNK